MKIGIISNRLHQPLTGVGTYTYNLIKSISAIAPNEDMYLIDYLKNEEFVNLKEILVAPCLRYLPKSSYWWNIYMQLKLRKNDFDIDIIHSPENSSLFMKLEHQKTIITVHDIIAYLFPEFTTSITGLRYRMLLSRTLNNSDRIIVDSNNTREDLTKHFNVPNGKITVIYLAADNRFVPLSENERNRARQKHQLDFPFVLYVGNLTKNKNIPVLIKAFYEIKKRGSIHKLVIAGMRKGASQEIFKTVDNLSLQNDVIFTGYFPPDDLPALYNLADLFVYPSLYEGFGLPPLEAMACGTPVISSNTTSLPEIIGSAGIMVDPNDITGFAEAMYDVIADGVLRERLVLKGLERAKLFNWEKTAKDTLRVYKEISNSA